MGGSLHMVASTPSHSPPHPAQLHTTGVLPSCLSLPTHTDGALVYAPPRSSCRPQGPPGDVRCHAGQQPSCCRHSRRRHCTITAVAAPANPALMRCVRTAPGAPAPPLQAACCCQQSTRRPRRHRRHRRHRRRRPWSCGHKNNNGAHGVSGGKDSAAADRGEGVNGRDLAGGRQACHQRRQLACHHWLRTAQQFC